MQMLRVYGRKSTSGHRQAVLPRQTPTQQRSHLTKRQQASEATHCRTVAHYSQSSEKSVLADRTARTLGIIMSSVRLFVRL